MKKVERIFKNRLFGEADYSAVLSGGDLSGYKLERVDCEPIEVSTGEVCFFDPYSPSGGKPFTVKFVKGKYRPFMMLVSTSNGKRVALAGLDGGFAQNSREWKLAFTDEREILKLRNPNEIVGTVIGSGFGALCDKKELNEFVKLVKDGEETFHPLDGAVNMDGSCAQVCDVKELKLPVFNTGWGEGTYKAFIGCDEKGTPTGVICDFAMVDYPPSEDTETVEFEFDVGVEELYVPDPKKSDAENSILKYTGVIESADADMATLFNAYSRRGYSYHTSGKFDEALCDYLKAIAVGRSTIAETNFLAHAWSLYDNAASICRESGKTEEAVRLYEEAKNFSDTFYSGAYSGLIDIYRDGKEYRRALAVADEMAAVRPSDPTAYLKRSEIYMACEEYEKAVSDLDVLISTYKLNESILDKALCLTFLGRHKEALDVLDTYLLEGRASEVYYDIRAEICLADNNFSAAYNAARKAFDVNPDYPAALEKLIALDSLLFNFKNVVKWATRYIEGRPRTEYGYLVRAESYFKMGEYADAVTDYAYLIQHINDTPQYCCMLIRAALAEGNKKLAKKYIKQLRKTDDAYYIFAAGLALLEEKKYSRAERYIASALALKEDDAVIASLIDCFIESGDYEKAEAAMKKYAELADGEEVFLKHAEIACGRGVPADAIEREYVARFLGGCNDEGLLEKVRGYFSGLRAV